MNSPASAAVARSTTAPRTRTRRTRSTGCDAVLRTTLIVVSLMLIASGCAANGPLPVADSVVSVRASGCDLVDTHGSGIAVGSDLVATAAHTVAGAAEIAVSGETSPERIAQVVGFDPEQDIAILRVDGAEWQPVEMGSAERGDRVLLATWRADSGAVVQFGSVSRLLSVTIEDIYLEELVHRDALEITSVEIGWGDSGGAVLTESGNLAGIVYAAAQDDTTTGYAVSAGAVAELLSQVSESAVDNGHCK